MVVRFGFSNPIIDPWIYILLRKENLMALQRRFMGFCKQKNVATDSGDQNVTPSSDSWEKSFDNTMSSGKTLSTDDLLTLDANENPDFHFEMSSTARC
jgi:hypothetical protein